MTWMGIDLGKRRVGVAISDPAGSFAMPHATLQIGKDGGFPMDDLLALIQECGAGGIGVGLPIRLDGSAGPEAEAAREFAAALRANVSAEVVLWDDPLADPERTMAFLASRDVRVIIAVLPAVMMEGSENNREFYTRFVKHLEHWRLKYSNVAAVLDINNNYDHAYKDPDLYTDLEHMTYDAAVKFSSDFAHLAPLNTSE